MGEKRGCMKTGLFGCLAIFVILIVFVGGTALVAWNHSGKVNVQEQVLTPQAAGPPNQVKNAKFTAVSAGTGRVVLDLAQGEFYVHAEQPGQGIRVEATYDTEIYLIEDYFESFPDSSWVYGVRSKRTISGLHALFRQIMAGGNGPKIHVYLPADVPLELQFQVQEGGCEVELGGLWITTADFRFKKGGFALNIADPLREPMERMTIRGTMGGFEAARLGNASPRLLDVSCRMGGADIDLRGAWTGDADIRMDVAMGGMGVQVPKDVLIQGVEGMEGAETRLQSENKEMPLPVLRFSLKQKMGEIEIYD
jgi:hypothetical protein